jgi:hypothetical protein
MEGAWIKYVPAGNPSQKCDDAKCRDDTAMRVRLIVSREPVRAETAGWG